MPINQVMISNYFVSFRNNILYFSAFLVFLIFQFFYKPIVFSDEYLENTSSWTCELDQDCLRYLKSDLDKQDNDSIYKVCDYDYKGLKNCCESLNNCPSNYGVERNLSNLKSNLLNSEGTQACSASSMANLMSSVDKTQKEVCGLGARDCKGFCKNRLNYFERRVKSCFSINSSLDEALKQAKKAGSNSSCYSKLKEVADKYKRQSRTGKSELRDNLSSQDIVNCEGLRNKGDTAVATKKIMGMCQEANKELLARKQAEEQKKAEEERIAKEEELKKAEQERQAEIERQRAEELKAEEAKKAEELKKYNEERAKQAEQREKEFEKLKVFARENHGEEYDEEKGKFVKIKKSEEETKSEKEDSLKKEGSNLQSGKNNENSSFSAGAGAIAGGAVGLALSQKLNNQNKASPIVSNKTSLSLSNENLEKSKIGALAGNSNTKNNLSFSKQTANKFNKSDEEPKGFLGKSKSLAKKSWDKTKSFSGKAWHNTKSFAGNTWDKTKTVSSKAWNYTQNKFSFFKTKTKRGLASFMSAKAGGYCYPQINYQMVYQSVEAPQIKPLKRQEFQSDPSNPIFKSYDLVRGKSAGVLIKMDYPQSCLSLDEKHFHLGMFIDQEFVETKCLSYKEKFRGVKEFTSDKPSVDDCYFSNKDFFIKNEIVKFIEFPMDVIDKNKQDIPIKVSVFDESKEIPNLYTIPIDHQNKKKILSCSHSINLRAVNEFCLNMHSAKSLSLGVLAIKGSCNNQDLSSSYYGIDNLIESDEVKEYLPSIFPMPETDNINDIIEPLKLKHLQEHVKDYEDFIKRKPLFQINQNSLPEHRFFSSPSCDNTKIWPNRIGREWSFGIPEMIKTFWILNRKSSKNRIVVTVSRDFLDYHNVPSSTVGFVWAYKYRSSYRNILFMNENYTETGTLLHEMGHSLDQLKEFYERFYNNNPKNPPVLCQRFNGSLQVFCKTQYIIPRGLKALNGVSFKWLTENNKSIMSNDLLIYNQWIDRETFQKTFLSLRTSATNHTHYQAEYTDYPKTIVSAFYNKETNTLKALETENLDFKPAYLTPPLTDGLSEEGKMNYIEIQLVKNNSTLYKLMHPSDMYIRSYNKNGEHEDISLPTSLIHAVIPIIGEGKFKIRFFKGTVWFDDKGEIIEGTSKEKLAGEIDFTWPEK